MSGRLGTVAVPSACPEVDPSRSPTGFWLAARPGPSSLVLLSCLLALGACNDTNCKQPVESRNCPITETPTGADLVINYSDPARFDSVVIQVFSGNVDDGQLQWTIRPASHSTSKKLENIEFGDYSAIASYYKDGDQRNAIDGDEVGTDSDSDGCGCVSYSEEDGNLDLELK